MSRDVTKVAPEPGGWYRALWNQPHPTAIGQFEVRNSVPLYRRNKFALVGSKYRWWDGERWLTEKGGRPSIFGTHGTHEFRGIRRWVLAQKASPIISALARRPVDAYLISARPRSANFGAMVQARPFKTEQAAQRFAARYAHLGLTAVLP